MDTYVLVVHHWHSKLNLFYVKVQVSGASVRIFYCAIDVDFSIKDRDGGSSGVSRVIEFFSPYSHADVVVFRFLNSDVSNEVFVSDFAAYRYLVFTNGDKISGVCYVLAGGAFSFSMPWRRHPSFLALPRFQIFLGPWRIFLRVSCFPKYGAVARDEMWSS